ncbi:putative transposase YbfD/YdcC [Rhodoblastus acidophilus]|nr:putative transposase YbfD/YdcC [Rhodoblastus acidophilus]
MVAGANSYRQLHEFIHIHRQRLNKAFKLNLRYAPSYSGLRLILQGIDSTALEDAFRRHALSLPTPAAAHDGATAVAVDGKTLRGSFDAFCDRKAAHMLSALRQADQIVLGHLMVDEKSNEIPAAPELIEALGLKGCLFTLDAEHCQKKSFARVIASGNHLLTQVKDNQPNLRRRLELGAMGRKSSGSATNKSKGRNRWETRELTMFPAKAWFRGTPWEMLIKTVLRLKRSVWKRDPKTGMLRQTNETVFWVSSLTGPTPE